MKYIRKHINEDYIGSYDSGIEDQTVDDIIDKFAEEQVLNCIKEWRQEWINKTFGSTNNFDDEYSNPKRLHYSVPGKYFYDKLSSININNIFLNTRTMRILGDIYMSTKYAINLYKNNEPLSAAEQYLKNEKFSTLEQLIDYIVETIEEKTEQLKMMISSMSVSGREKYLTMIINDFIKPMKAELLQIKDYLG